MQLEARGFVLRRNWIAPALVFAAGVVGALVALLGGVILGWMVAWFGLLMGPILLARNAFPHAKPVILRASERGLGIDEHVIEAEHIQEVKIVPRGHDGIVTLLDKDGSVFVLRMAYPQGRQLVHLLGARRAAFRLMVPLWSRVLGSLLAIAIPWFLLLGEAGLFTLPALAMLALVAAGLLGYLRGRLVVGSDGFTTTWLGVNGFVPYRDVLSVERKASLAGSQLDALVRFHSGKKTRYRVLETPNTEEERHAEVLALIGHLSEAAQRAAYLGGVRVDVPALVARGGRSERDWLAAINMIVRGRGQQYRVAALSAELLADVTTDPTAAADSRLGAAAALVRIGEEPARVKVRVAAEGCADPELRSALLAMADSHDDDTAEAALRVLRR